MSRQSGHKRRYNRAVHPMNRNLTLSSLALLACALSAAAFAQSNQPPTSTTDQIPVIDGDAGSCSVEFTITTADGKPVAAATVKVHIAYGFGGFHKLDLQAGTNSDGKVKFTGLPSRVRRSTLEFEASKDLLAGTATLDPAKECRGKREIKLGKGNAAAN